MKKLYRVSVTFPHTKYAKKDHHEMYFAFAKNEEDATTKVRKKFTQDLSEYKFYAWECLDDAAFSHSYEW